MNQIYIATPDHYEAGGVESLYQLADAINNNGGTGITVFPNPNNDPIPNKYLHYNINYANNIEDLDTNLIIMPEVWTEQLYQFKNIQKAIWWLSVDNNHGKFQDFTLNIIHFYQSYYALSYLLGKKASRYLPLFDYIQPKYVDAAYNISQKQNIVCYNPAKGQEFTNAIISANPNITFVPLVNMNEDQIIKTLTLSKIYIDFGNHPGRDRIPREAALLGNCIITNKSGSAGFYNDITILNIYKTTNTHDVGNIIMDIFNNFALHFNNFTMYRSIIKNQKQQTYNQIKGYFI
jgi:hypothetical protein